MYQPRPLHRAGGYDLRLQEMRPEALQKYYSSSHMQSLSPEQMRYELEKEMKECAASMQDEEAAEMKGALEDLKQMMAALKDHPMRQQKLAEMQQQAAALIKEIGESGNQLVEEYSYYPIHYAYGTRVVRGYPTTRRWWRWRRYRNPYLWYNYRPWRYVYRW